VRIVVIRHFDGGDPGVLAVRARAQGHTLHFCAPHAGDPLPEDGFDAVVVLGGSANVVEGHDYLQREIDYLAANEKPALGICLGAQLLARSAGGEVLRARAPEIGWFEVRLTADGREDPLLSVLPERFSAYQWHSYTFESPAHPLAVSDLCPQAFRLGRHAWGVQFHPEVDEAIVADWSGDFRSDPDAVEMGFDPDAHLAEARHRLPEWNRLGGLLFDRFLTLAARVGQRDEVLS
jgi:GMP synthase (glutamine-hydrolysing)